MALPPDHPQLGLQQMNNELLVVASTVSVLTIVVVGATIKVLDHLRWIVDRLDRIQATLIDRDRR